MKTILYLLTVITALLGFAILGSAKSAIHEIEAFVLFVISAVLLSGAVIVGALKSIEEKLEMSQEKASPDEKSKETSLNNENTITQEPPAVIESASTLEVPAETVPNAVTEKTQEVNQDLTQESVPEVQEKPAILKLADDPNRAGEWGQVCCWLLLQIVISTIHYEQTTSY